MGRSQWPRDRREGPAATSFLWLWGSNPAGRMDISCECCVLSGTGLWVGLITRPEEFHRGWRVWVWSWRPARGKGATTQNRIGAPHEKRKIIYYLFIQYCVQVCCDTVQFCRQIPTFLSNLLSLPSILWKQRQQVPPKYWYPPAGLHDVII
jgi:hypothetical protein